MKQIISFIIGVALGMFLLDQINTDSVQWTPDYKKLYLKANGDIKRFQDSINKRCLCN